MDYVSWIITVSRTLPKKRNREVGVAATVSGFCATAAPVLPALVHVWPCRSAQLSQSYFSASWSLGIFTWCKKQHRLGPTGHSWGSAVPGRPVPQPSRGNLGVGDVVLPKGGGNFSVILP